MNRPETIEALAAMSVLWPSMRLPDDDATVDVIVAMAQRQWSDLESAAVLAAIEVLSAEGREFAPTVGQVSRRARELVELASGARPPDVDEAWGEVRRQIAHRGAWATFTEEPLEWSHPIVGEVVERMGWLALCGSTNEVADRAHFARMYEAARERGVTDAVARRALARISMPELRSLDAELGD